ncbi:MAG: hypothetical protein P4L42_15155 [Desulfocapsaceae bacterium]|nr:hypothetical protein [Desulfocapsaceae bacterium]
MNGRILLSLMLLVLLASCSLRQGPPEMAVPGRGDAPPRHAPAFFPVGKWQFVHSISFQLAQGGAGTAVGVLVLDKDEIRCVLTTVEGLVLFEARWLEGQPIAVSRAIAPFDNQGFAAGLMADVHTIFRRPEGREDWGRLPDGAAVFRYAAAGQVTDVLPQEDGCWSMQTYGDRDRTIRARSCTAVDSTVIPKDIDLVAGGPAGYSLTMHLLSAEKL